MPYLHYIVFFYFYANDFYMNVHIVDFFFIDFFTVDIYMYSQFWFMTLMYVGVIRPILSEYYNLVTYLHIFFFY